MLGHLQDESISEFGRVQTGIESIELAQLPLLLVMPNAAL